VGVSCERRLAGTPRCEELGLDVGPLKGGGGWGGGGVSSVVGWWVGWLVSGVVKSGFFSG
jgi:hypothetical protein